jgi:phage/plasmid-like protein (TIGR03299 family)
MTGVDGTLATSAKFVSTRVVCNNTLRLAVEETGGREARRTHRQQFDASDIKLDLGLLDNTWAKYVENMQKLASFKMTDKFASDFFKALVTPEKDKKNPEISRATKKTVEDLMTRLRSGMGAEMGRGTAWNCLNAITEKYSHGSQRRDSNRQFVNSLYGADANIKDRAADQLLALAA